MSRILVLSGLPGSGKSTWAREHLRGCRGRAGIVSRDAVREHVLGLSMEPGDQVLDRAGEAVVTAVAEAMARALLAAGCDVVADATHLDPAHIDRWRQVAAEYGTVVEVIDLGVPLEECIRRDADRAAVRLQWVGGRRVGEDVIREMAARGRPTY